MKRCIRCDQIQPPSADDVIQPCPFCGYAEGAEYLDPLDGEPAGPSIIKKWAKWLVLGITFLSVSGSLWLVLQFHNSFQRLINVWF